MNVLRFLSGDQSRFERRPFSRLAEIKWRAEQLLGKSRRGLQKLDVAAGKLLILIDNYKEDVIEKEIARHATQLYFHGGRELSWLPNFDNDRQPGMEEISTLLRNMPLGANSDAFPLDKEDIDDLDSLKAIVNEDDRIDIFDDGEFVNREEFYAVLGLVKINDALSLLDLPLRKTESGIVISDGFFPWNKEKLVLAGNLLIEAMECVCFAERETLHWSLLKSKLESENEIRKLMDVAVQTEKAARLDFSAIGRNGAAKRHSAMAKLRQWAVERYLSKSWPSANNAAHTLMEEVIAHGRLIGAHLKDSNAQRTIAEWFRKAV